jgi:hypothetical protein
VAYHWPWHSAGPARAIRTARSRATAWTFGDGSSASGVSTSHTYVAAGTYAAKLTVTDNLGATGVKDLTITATADTNAINAPSGLSASASKPGTATLRWTDNSTNEQGFYIERAPSATGVFARVGTAAANATTFPQSGVASGTYLFRVQAFNTHDRPRLRLFESG